MVRCCLNDRRPARHLEIPDDLAAPVEYEPGHGSPAAVLTTKPDRMGTPTLRPFIGASCWHTNRMGRLKAGGGRLGLRYTVAPESRFTPYALASVNTQVVQARIGDKRLEDAYEGFAIGGGLGAGLNLGLDEQGHVSLVAEGRRSSSRT